MNTEQLYKLKNTCKKELKPIIDELILLREHRERIEHENTLLKHRVIYLTETNKQLEKCIDTLGKVVNNEKSF